LSGRPESFFWIAHPADRLNVAIALAAPFLLFAPYFVDIFKGHEIIYAVVLFIFIGKANYLLHLHIHRPFSRNRYFNLLLDLSLDIVTGMTSSNWRIQHLYGHHRGIDLPYRGKRAWQMEQYSTLRAISYSTVSLWGTFYAPIVESFHKGILANLKLPTNYRWAFCEQVLLLMFVAGLLFWQPWLTLTYLLPWYFVTHFITRYVDYLNHYGCNEASTNPYVRANNSLSWWFNVTTQNFGYHTAHHIRPGAHWTELPEIHRKIADQIPPAYLKPFSWSASLNHFYRSRKGRM
jgi:fatty acid desaturase